MKLGATSWQDAGTYVDNVRLLAGHASFCELLVYTWNDEIEDQLEREWDAMASLLELSVHLPADSTENAAAALQFFREREVLRFIVHPIVDVAMLQRLLTLGVNLVGDRLCLENLENDVFETVYAQVEDIPFSVTLDYGHLLLTGMSPDRFADLYGERVAEVHFHGCDGSRCHILPDEATLAGFGDFMERRFAGRSTDMPVCVETFEWPVTRFILDSLARTPVAATPGGS
jgi:hypothetical protein